jgi:hypothetical protein
MTKLPPGGTIGGSSGRSGIVKVLPKKEAKVELTACPTAATTRSRRRNRTPKLAWYLGRVIAVMNEFRYMSVARMRSEPMRTVGQTQRASPASGRTPALLQT